MENSCGRNSNPVGRESAQRPKPANTDKGQGHIDQGNYMGLAREVAKASIFCAIFLCYVLVISLAGYTLVPVDLYYKRGHLPWALLDPKLASSRDWNFGDYRDGDALFEVCFSAQEALIQSWGGVLPPVTGQSGYSLDAALGYPLGPGQNFPRGISAPLARILGAWGVTSETQAVYLSANFTAWLWFSVAFSVTWVISHLFWQRSFYSFLVSTISSPVLIQTVSEPFIMGFSGTLLIALGLEAMIRYRNGALSRDILGCAAVSFGSIIVFRSGFYHFFLYVPLLYVMSVGLLISRIGVRCFLLAGLGILVGIVWNLGYLYDVMHFLSESNKAVGGPAPLLAQRGYAAVPIQALVPLPGLGFVARKLDFHVLGLSAIDLARVFPPVGLGGFPVAVLGFIGWLRCDDKWIKATALLVFLYWTGPLQYLLAHAVGGPFATETSNRMEAFLLLLACFLAVYSVQQGLQRTYRRFIVIAGTVVLAILFLEVAAIFVLVAKVWLSGIFAALAVIPLMLSACSNERRRSTLLAAAALLVLSLAGTAYTGCQTLLLTPMRAGVPPTAVMEARSNQSADVGAIVSGKESLFTFHPNFWNYYRLRNVHSYRNPLYLRYAQLYWYQYELGCSTEESLLNQDRSSALLRGNWLWPIVMDGNLSTGSRRFLELAGVNYLASDMSVDLSNEKWTKIREAYGVRVWNRKRDCEPVRVVCAWRSITSPLDRIRALLCEGAEAPDFKTEAVLDRDENCRPCQGHPRVLSTRLGTNGVLEINLESTGGLLVTNVPFDRNWVALELLSQTRFETIQCNHAFLCVKIPDTPGEKRIRLSYEAPGFSRAVSGLYLRLQSPGEEKGER